MLAQHHVKLNRKGISSVLTTILMVLMVVLAVTIFWTATKRIVQESPNEKIDCVTLYNEIKINKACYLNDNEIKVIVKRNFDNSNFEKMRFAFSGDDSAIWEITGKKCSDVRVGVVGRYGGYCDIVEIGNTITYVFNVVGIGKIDNVKLGVGNGNLCSVSENSVDDGC